MSDKKIKKTLLRGNIPFLMLAGLLLVGSFYIGSLSSEIKMLREGTVAGKTIQENNTKTEISQENNETQESNGIVEVSVDDDPVLGDQNAPLTMVEFSDYECPFCKKYFEESFSQIKDKYVNTGKLKIVYRDLPLPFHDPMATKEAIAANCARAQKGDAGYFDYHDEIFKRTSSNGNGLSETDLDKIAQDLGLNLNQFNNCLADESQENEVKNDLADAQKVGATGTPTLFIGKSTGKDTIKGEKIVGAQPFSAFETVIEKYLN